jgi:hypothetical protein
MEEVDTDRQGSRGLSPEAALPAKGGDPYCLIRMNSTRRLFQRFSSSL